MQKTMMVKKMQKNNSPAMKVTRKLTTKKKVMTKVMILKVKLKVKWIMKKKTSVKVVPAKIIAKAKLVVKTIIKLMLVELAGKNKITGHIIQEKKKTVMKNVSDESEDDSSED